MVIAVEVLGKGSLAEGKASPKLASGTRSVPRGPKKACRSGIRSGLFALYEEDGGNGAGLAF